MTEIDYDHIFDLLTRDDNLDCSRLFGTNKECVEYIFMFIDWAVSTELFDCFNDEDGKLAMAFKGYVMGQSLAKMTLPIARRKMEKVRSNYVLSKRTIAKSL